MIPITSSFPISIEKTAKLVQRLVDLNEKENVDIPEQIANSVNALIEAQATLIKEIQEFFGGFFYKKNIYENENEMDFKTAKAIVESYPQFLAVENSGWLPIRHAAYSEGAFSNKYFKLYLDLGLKYNIGGKYARGGLVTNENERGNPIQLISEVGKFEILRQMNPPLFCIKDIQKYYLLHCSEDADLTRYLCDLDPSSVHQRDKQNRLPIHQITWFVNEYEGAKDVIECLIHFFRKSHVPNHYITTVSISTYIHVPITIIVSINNTTYH